MPRGDILSFPTAALSDSEARAKALDVTASWIVEAPAGSGKTGLLMQRYLKLLAHNSVEEPDEVLAITFTRKATAELRERVLAQLASAADPVPSEGSSTFELETRSLALAVVARDTTRGWGLLDNPRRLNIRTIDSVSSDIAFALPLLSGASAAGSPSDQPDELYKLAAQRTLLQLGNRDTPMAARLDDALHTVLRHRDASLTDVEALLARMLAQREQWGELVPLGAQLDDETLDSEVRPKLERALEAIVCGGLTRAAKAMSAEVLSALSWLAASLAGLPGYKEPSPIAICANSQEPPEERAEHLDHWLALIGLLIKKDGDWRMRVSRADVKFEVSPEGKQQLEDILSNVRENEELRLALCDVRALPPSRYPDSHWHVAKALFHLLLRALAELRVLFAERSECDFTELTLAAKHALRALEDAAAAGDLSLAAGSKLRHLLVDEMQDTSSSQYELIELLTRSWDGHSQTLFLVGDPKQSIYLFRQARVERFLRAMREARMGDIPLGPLYLKANFRSQATLVENFNQDFREIFSASSSRGSEDVPFVEAQPVNAASPAASARVWHTCVSKETTHDSGTDLLNSPETPAEMAHARDEARSIRHIVEAWRAKPLPADRTRPWDIAVLARSRSHLTQVIAEFQDPDAAGIAIPFTAVEIERLGDRPEVLDLLALTRALLHPADRVAWLAILHAPWCGLGIADLLALSGNGATETQYEAIPATAPARRELLSAIGRQLFDRTWPTLTAALDQRGRTSTATWVERTWRSLGGDAALGSRGMANAMLFLAALRKQEQPGGRVDLSRLSSNVKNLFAEPQSAPDAVTLSTIHKAKGLEWDVVLVPGLERKSANNQSELLNWLELDASDNEQASIILAPIWGKGGEPDALYKWLNAVRSRREEAEHKRVLYVAATRARQELHLFAAATRNAAGELCAPAASLLKAAWPAALPYFDKDIQSAPQVTQIKDSLRNSLDVYQPLALAASGEESVPIEAKIRTPPTLHRLPLSFFPQGRFTACKPLPYTPAAALPATPTFDRPEGGFAVRAFGNVVHRYLQLLSARLETDPAPENLTVATWLPRLTTSFRAEGLAPTLIPRLAQRALQALQRTLADPAGLWIVSPHVASQSEQSLPTQFGDLRTDRTFLAGPTPGSMGSSHFWIVDFKTSEQGSRSKDVFAEEERAKYGPQLETYARAYSSLPGSVLPTMLGLYYPLIPQLLSWPAMIFPAE